MVIGLTSHRYSWMKAKDCSPAFKKQDTAGDRTLSWQCQECHHRGLLLFVVAVRAKAKPGGTKYLFLQEKKTHPRLAVTISPLQRGFLLTLGHEAETRKQETGFPHPQHGPQQCSYKIPNVSDLCHRQYQHPWWCSKPFIHPNLAGRIVKTCKVYGCNVKEDNNLGLPPPTPHDPPHMSGFFLLTWSLELLMIVIYRNGCSRIYHSDVWLSTQNRTNPRGRWTTKLSRDSLQWFSDLVQFQVNLNKITEKREGCPPSHPAETPNQILQCVILTTWICQLNCYAELMCMQHVAKQLKPWFVNEINHGNRNYLTLHPREWSDAVLVWQACSSWL